MGEELKKAVENTASNVIVAEGGTKQNVSAFVKPLQFREVDGCLSECCIESSGSD